MEEGRRKNSGKASKTNDCEHYAGSMATVFWNHLQPSPLHIVGSAQMLPTSIHSLFKVFVNADPAPKHQWAITPYLLQGMYTLAGLAFPESHDTPAAIAADLAIVGLFFAVRSYENTTIPQPDQTKMVDMLGVTFLDNNKCEIPQDCPSLALAIYVTLLFADQKKGGKNIRRAQSEPATLFVALSNTLHH